MTETELGVLSVWLKPERQGVCNSRKGREILRDTSGRLNRTEKSAAKRPSERWDLRLGTEHH